ncbi:MAG TPA: polysaccharide deacetylase family protein [Candidatus Limnocylindria bacterium]|nr:polysaccharide deacetylase family protein [Candidatus Limnocylindria bacterium]
MSLAVSLHGRGATGTIARTAMVVSRFVATASAMARRLDRYASITRAHGVRPTWPTTACVLERHPRLLRRYADEGAELAVHGLVHGDHAAVDRRRQQETIARAFDIFAHAGLRPSGFRGPYLRYNEATRDVLRALGVRYHSSQAFVFPMVSTDIDATAAARYALALKLYAAVDARTSAVRPRLQHGLVDIPVAVPDDEILLDRLRLAEPALSAEWLHILELTYRRGELFTVQLHPERIPELGDALDSTLTEARGRRPAVWIARLDEIAGWWLRRAHFSLVVTRAGVGRCHVRLDADADATLLVRGLAVPRSPWHGADSRCESREFEVEAARLPVVSISRRSPAEVAAFVAEEGYATQISDDGEAFGAHVDVSTPTWSESSVLDTIAAAPGPLVRVWRWPDGARSALAVSGDIDALTLRDFVARSWETRDWVARGEGSRA